MNYFSFFLFQLKSGLRETETKLDFSLFFPFKQFKWPFTVCGINPKFCRYLCSLHFLTCRTLFSFLKLCCLTNFSFACIGSLRSKRKCRHCYSLWFCLIAIFFYLCSVLSICVQNSLVGLHCSRSQDSVPCWARLYLAADYPPPFRKSRLAESPRLESPASSAAKEKGRKRRRRPKTTGK